MSAALDCSTTYHNHVELAARKVGASMHIGYGGAFYSVPSSLFNQMVFVRASNDSINILNSDGDCVATHKRTYIKRRYITVASHMPQYYLSQLLDISCYDGAKLRSWAGNIGHYTFLVIDKLLKLRQFEEHSYKSCMAVLQLSKKYGSSNLESACQSALNSSVCSFYAIKKLLILNTSKA